ncbi:tetratricopeptide repeat protein [Streptomyces citrinus]|uniref:tetratricopeptide repeat protein n=1 Tax=Streptomyces citrinus TaxID=3118173 RepID=UPI003CC6BAB5
MTTSPYTQAAQSPRPNLAFRALRGQRSPGEFAAAVRRAARQIGERVSCDARYIGRVEAGEIRCPNYAYERVFLHMFPGRTLADLGFAPRSAVRGRSARPAPPADESRHHDYTHHHEESDVRRRAFMTGMTGSTATVAVATLTPFSVPSLPSGLDRHPARAGVGAVEEAIRRIRLLDDRHGADGLYRRAADPLRTAFELLDSGTAQRDVAERLQAGAGELAISVGWLAHDSGRFDDARSHYAEALATARMAGDEALEAHAFCNTAFLARDAGRPREAVRAAQAATRIAAHLGSPRLLSLLALREAGAGPGSATVGRASGRWRGRRRCSRGARRRPTRSGCRSTARPSWRAWRRSAGRRSATGAVRPGTRGGPRRSRTRTSRGTSRSTRPSTRTTWPARASPTRPPPRAADARVPARGPLVADRVDAGHDGTGAAAAPAGFGGGGVPGRPRDGVPPVGVSSSAGAWESVARFPAPPEGMLIGETRREAAALQGRGELRDPPRRARGRQRTAHGSRSRVSAQPTARCPVSFQLSTAGSP